MGKQLLIIFMIFVTFLAIYIVYQPEEQINLNIPEKKINKINKMIRIKELKRRLTFGILSQILNLFFMH